MSKQQGINSGIDDRERRGRGPGGRGKPKPFTIEARLTDEGKKESWWRLFYRHFTDDWSLYGRFSSRAGRDAALRTLEHHKTLGQYKHIEFRVGADFE